MIDPGDYKQMVFLPVRVCLLKAGCLPTGEAAAYGINTIGKSMRARGPTIKI